MVCALIFKFHAYPLDLLRSPHTLSSNERRRRDNLCTLILPIISDVLPRLIPDLFGSPMIKDFFICISHLTLKCEEHVLREILLQDTTTPFLSQLLQNAAVYFSRPNVHEYSFHHSSLFDSLILFLAPLAFLDENVYQLCKKHLVPQFGRSTWYDGIHAFLCTIKHRGDHNIGLEWRRDFAPRHWC